MESSKNFKSFKVWIQAIHISLTGFIFLYSIGVFNPCQLNVAGTLKWGSDTSLYINLFSTILAIGQTIGCIITTKLIDHYGRRMTIIMMDISFILGSIILVMPSTVCFGIGRFIVGVSTGVGATVGPLYLGEATPIELMPKVGPIIYVISGVGMISSYAFGLMLPIDNFESDPKSYLWIFMFLFPTLIAVYQLIYFICFVKYDTPQFYLAKNKSFEAERALKETHDDQSVSHGLRRVNSEIEGKSINGVRMSLLGMICNKKFRKMFRVAVMFSALQQLCGITAILFYSTTTFTQLGGGLYLARVLTLVIGITNCLSMLFGIWLLNLFGRKTILIVGQVTISAILFILALFSGYVGINQVVAAIFLVAFFIPSGCSIVCTGWMYATEVLNDQIFSSASSMSFGFSIIVAFTFPISVDNIGISSTFLIFSIFMAIFAVYSAFDFVETKDKDKETILIQMGVIEKKVAPRVDDNDSLRSPNECEEEENGNEKSALDEGVKGFGLNSTGFNNSALNIEEKST